MDHRDEQQVPTARGGQRQPSPPTSTPHPPPPTAHNFSPFSPNPGADCDPRTYLSLSPASVDRNVRQALPMRPCFSCGAAVFEGALSCSACKSSFPCCAITGYPMAAAVTCAGCSARCAKATWNEIARKLKKCLLCGVSSSPSL